MASLQEKDSEEASKTENGKGGECMVREKQFYKTLLLIALPVALQNLLTFAVNTLDMVMIGSMGDVTYAATAQANYVSIYMMTIVRGLVNGAAILISQYWGKNDIRRIKTIFGIGMKTSLLVSVIVTVLIMVIPQKIMGITSNDELVIAEGVRYLGIVAFSYILYAISQSLVAMLRCVELIRIGLISSIVALFVNAFGNYVLIFGKLGFSPMGIEGAAIATLLSRVVECLIIVIYVAFIDKRLKLRIRDLIPNDWQLWKDYFKHGLPVTSGEILWGFVGLLKGVIIGRLVTEAVTANSIAENVLQLATAFISGLSSASAVMIGKTVGAGEYDKTRHYARTLQILFFAFGLVAATMTYLIRMPMIRLYTLFGDGLSQKTQEYAMEFLLYGAITIWATSYAASCFVGINRGSGDGRFVVVVDMICGWLIVLPLMYLALRQGWPAPLVFLMSRIDQFLKVGIAFVRLNFTKGWICNVTRD